MDVLVFYSSLILISLLTTCLFNAIFSHQKNKLPPGNLGLPLVGESIEFFSYLRAGISEKFIFRRMAKYSHDVFKTSLIAEPMAVMCGSEGSRFLFNNDNKLVRQWWPLGLNTILGRSRQSPFPLKNIVIRFFRGEDLKKQVGIMDRLAKRHLEIKWHGLHQVTVLPLARNFAFTVACSLALSMEKADHIDKLQGLLTTILAGFLKPKINLPGTAYNRAVKAWDTARKQLSEIVARRRTTELLENAANLECSGFRDTLSSLLAAIRESGEEMSDADVADRIIGVLVVIHDTTSVVITMIFKYLAMHPHVYNAVFRENMEVAAKKAAGQVHLNWEDVQKLKYTWNVTQEVMRVFPPAQGLLREALVDFSYAGFRIPKGWKLLMSIKAIQMDPKYFPEPEKFDPTRFQGKGPLPNTYMPFGGGLNMCPGNHFAQAMVLVFIHNAVTRFKWELLHDYDEQVLVDPIPRPTGGIPVRLYQHPCQFPN